MLVETVNSDYSDINNIKDVPDRFFGREVANPLFIAAREGQVTRVDKQVVANDKGTVVGTWQLGDLGYLNKDGTMNSAKFKDHDMIFASDPRRVHPKFRSAYEALLWQLKGL